MAVAQLHHPHIVRILELDVDRNSSTPYIVMNYAPHGNLRQLYPRGSIVPIGNIIFYVRQVADALQYAHEAQLIHRDVKPENLLLGSNYEVLLSDFGIATLSKNLFLSKAQKPFGTIPYMAPEQIRGIAGAASDQYSLGIIVYEWLTGTLPFSGTYREIAKQHWSTPPPLLRTKVPALSSEIEQVVLTALKKDPQQRYASVNSFAIALEQAQGLCLTLREKLEGDKIEKNFSLVFSSLLRK